MSGPNPAQIRHTTLHGGGLQSWIILNWHSFPASSIESVDICSELQWRISKAWPPPAIDLCAVSVPVPACDQTRQTVCGSLRLPLNVQPGHPIMASPGLGSENKCGLLDWKWTRARRPLLSGKESSLFPITLGTEARSFNF